MVEEGEKVVVVGDDKPKANANKQSETQRLSEIVTVKGNKYHKNTGNVFAEIGNAINSFFGGDPNYFVEHKPYDPIEDKMMQEYNSTAMGFVAGGVVGKVVGKGIGALASSTVSKGGLLTVGRWMSKTEYQIMLKTGQMVEGAGGQTFLPLLVFHSEKKCIRAVVWCFSPTTRASATRQVYLSKIGGLGVFAFVPSLVFLLEKDLASRCWYFFYQQHLRKQFANYKKLYVIY